ncbi:MAG: aminotransferase class I/II-fold pyridoxal phosphate-dependent enzyme [Solirubrobacteraceae bacterium]
MAEPEPGAQLRAPYLEAIAAFGRRAPRRYFVPGHNGGPGADPGLLGEIGPSAFALDLPQDTAGVDTGPIPGGGPTPLAEAERLAAAAYGAGRTWFLTNGASQGNHAVLLALAPTGTEVLVQRNSHGSVVDGLVLSGGTPRYLAPGYDEDLGMATVVSAGDLERAIARWPQARAALLVSPTYFGLVADVTACAEVARAAGILLVVDGAWGPHFGFHEDLPVGALTAGADVVLTSTHKHAGSLTQSAMLHVARDRPDVEAALGRAVRMLRSTSPSSLLLASLDGARRQLAAHGAGLLDITLARVRALAARIDAIDGCRTLGPRHPSAPFAGTVAHDPLRIVVDVRGTGHTGLAIRRRLSDELDTHVELATHSTIVLVIGIQAPEELLQEFPAALKRALRTDPRDGGPAPALVAPPHRPGEAVITPRQAHEAAQEPVPPADAAGRIAAETISGYPPGVPAVLPGERITTASITHLTTLRDAGVRLHGPADPELTTLRVVREEGAG